ncbi:TrmB family transcriptional regulator [Amycolatopsis sp. cg5]|uniref:TrmB family transcriptional regulator n=1 Tax=Amycolatopsis sp. cg5 TaxID=3238802 RepID=UPI0035233D75
MTLDSLGVNTTEQRVYEVLLRHPDVTLAQLTELTRMTAERLRGLVNSLADKGMLSRTPGRPTRLVAAPPDIAVEILALRRREEIERARLAGAALGARFRTEGGPVLQVVRGREAIAHRFRQLQQVAKQEVLILDKPPYVVEPDEAQDKLQRDVQARGVRYRTIYDHSTLDQPERLDSLRRLTSCGEQARAMTGVPTKLVIADRRLGLVPYELPSDHQAVLLRPSAVLTGLVTLFDQLWDRASPLWPDSATGAQINADDQQLLALLAAGLTDQAIARKLGVAQRTVERRVRRVMDSLGARTRFQAGLQAAIRGLLGPP